MQKNHSFIVDVFYELCQRENNAWLLLVGDGPLAEEVLAKAEQLKLDERVILAGVRDDVPELMVHAMDVFLFPSRFEGLGLVLLEAQAAGLPCVVADTVPAEARLVDGLIHQVPLTASPSRWADSVLAARETGVGREQALATVSDSMYSIEGSVEALESFYLSTLARDDSVLRTANG
jgi:glycosyltransferase involved in cell wall biosynthesis